MLPRRWVVEKQLRLDDTLPRALPRLQALGRYASRPAFHRLCHVVVCNFAASAVRSASQVLTKWGATRSRAP
jgi:hypothetical protein